MADFRRAFEIACESACAALRVRLGRPLTLVEIQEAGQSVTITEVEHVMMLLDQEETKNEVPL